MATVYGSKIDAWLAVVLVVAMVCCLAASAFALYVQRSAPVLAIAIFTVAIGAGLPLWLLSSTRYALEPGQLRVQSGPFKWRIPIADITAITPTSNPLSSPALSLDRLRIDYGKGRSVMISPRDKQGFLGAMESARAGGR
jgi:membrane protein YdbS with pleckstrin-like domain